MKKNVYAVSGMKCVHCKANVENALKALNGVVSAELILKRLMSQLSMTKVRLILLKSRKL